MRRAAVLLLGFALARATGAAGAEPMESEGAGGIRASRATAETAGGVRLATFETPQGTIQAYLPAELQPGDCASGAVRLEPSGRDAAARRSAAASLERHTLHFGTESAAAGGSSAAWHVPTGAAKTIPLTLANPEGRELARTEVPISSPKAAVPRADTVLPVLAEAGGTGAASGRFGCETPRVRLDGKPAEILAASPRIVVFSVPSKPLGARALEVVENGTPVRGTVHAVSIALSAPRTKLMRGEQTVATVVVSGLLGLEDSVTLTLTNESPGIVSMRGGNVQPVTIHPSEIGRAGTFRTERALTGIEPGTFTIAAVLPLPDEGRAAAPPTGEVIPPASLREALPTRPPVREELPTRPPVREEIPTPPASPLEERRTPLVPVVPAAPVEPQAPTETPAHPATRTTTPPEEPLHSDPGVPWWLGGIVVALAASSLLVGGRPKREDPPVFGWMAGGLPRGVVFPPAWDPKKIEEALRKAVEEVTKAGKRLEKAGEDYNKVNDDYTKAQEEYFRLKEYYDWLLDLLTNWRPFDAPYGGPKMPQRSIHREPDGHGGLKPPKRGDVVEEDVYTRHMTQREVEEELQKAKAAMDHAFEIVKKQSAAWTKARQALDKAAQDVKDGADWVDHWRQELALGPPDKRVPPTPAKPFDPFEGVERIGGQPALVEHAPQLFDPITPEERQKIIDEWKKRIPPFPPPEGPGPGDLTFDDDGKLVGWWLPPEYSIEEEIRYFGRGRDPVVPTPEGAAPHAWESRGEALFDFAGDPAGAWVPGDDGKWIPVDPLTGLRREEKPAVRSPEAMARAKKKAEEEMKRRIEASDKDREKEREEESGRAGEAENERLRRQRDFVPPADAPPGTWVRDPSGRWIEIDPKTGDPLVKVPPERSSEAADAARKKAEEAVRKREAADHEAARKAEEERDKEQKESDDERDADQGRRDRAAPQPPGKGAWTRGDDGRWIEIDPSTGRPIDKMPPARTPEESEEARKRAEAEMKRRDEAHQKDGEAARAGEEQRHRDAEEERRREAHEREKAAKEEEEERLYRQGRRDAASPPPAGPGAWVRGDDGTWIEVDPRTGHRLGKAPRTPEEQEAARKKALAEMKRREEAHEKERETERAEEEKQARASEEEIERLIRQAQSGEPPAPGEVWARDRRGRWVKIDPRTGMPAEPPPRERTPEEAEAARKKAEQLVGKREQADHAKAQKAEQEREKKTQAADEERWGRSARPDSPTPPGPGAWVRDPAGRWIQIDPRTGWPVPRERTPQEAEAAKKRAEKEMERRERVWQEQRKKRQEADAKRRWDRTHPAVPPVAPVVPKAPPPPSGPPPDPIRDDVRAWAKGALGLTDPGHPLVSLLIGIGREIGIERLRGLLRDFRPSDPVSGLVELLERLQPKTGDPGDRLRTRQAILEVLDGLARDPERRKLWGITDPTTLTPLFEAAVSRLVDEALADGTLDALLQAAVALARPKELGGNPEHPRAGELRKAIERRLDAADEAQDREDHEKIASGGLDGRGLRDIADKALREHRFKTYVDARLAALAKSILTPSEKAAEAIVIAKSLKKLSTLPIEAGMPPDVVNGITQLRKKVLEGLDELKKGLEAGLVSEFDRLIDDASDRARVAAGEAFVAHHEGNKEKENDASERRQAAIGEIIDLGRLREMLATSPLDESGAKRDLNRRLEEATKALSGFESPANETEMPSERSKGGVSGHLEAMRARRDAIQDVLNGFDPEMSVAELDRIYDALNGTWQLRGGDFPRSDRDVPDGTGSRSTSAGKDFRGDGVRQKLDEARRHGTPDQVRRLEEDLDYYERRRIQVLLGHPGWNGLENYVRIKEHEKAYWKSQKNWKELAWMVETPADRWSAEIPAYRSRDLPGLISAVARANEDPQAFIRFLGALRAEDVAAGAEAWAAYYATPLHERGLVVQTWRLAHVTEILQKMGADRDLAFALQAAGMMPVEKLKQVHPEAYDLLVEKGFVQKGRYAVPDDFQYTPETVGSQMSQRHWLDDVLNIQNVAELVLTVLVPAAGAGWVVGGIEGLQAARGATRLARGGYFLARAAIEAALFTAFSKGVRGAIHPFSLSAKELSPEALAKETATNFVAILGLGLLGRAAAPLEKILVGEGKAMEVFLKPISEVGRADVVILLKKTGFEGVKVSVEAGGMTVLSGDVDPKTFPQSFLHNLVFLAELRALHPEAWNEALQRQRERAPEIGKSREAGGASVPGEAKRPVIAETSGKPDAEGPAGASEDGKSGSKKLEAEEFTLEDDDATPQGKKPRPEGTGPLTPLTRLLREMGIHNAPQAKLKEKVIQELGRLAEESSDPIVREKAAYAKRVLEGTEVPVRFGGPDARGEYDPFDRDVTINATRIANEIDAYARENLDRPATPEEFLRSLVGTMVHEALVHAYQGTDAMPWKEGQTRPYNLAHEIEAFFIQRLFDPTLGGKDPLGAYRDDFDDVLRKIVSIVTDGYANAIDPVRRKQLEKMDEAEFFGHTTKADEARMGPKVAKLRGLRGEGPPPADAPKAGGPPGPTPTPPATPTPTPSDKAADVPGEKTGPPPETPESRPGGESPENPGTRFMRELGIDRSSLLRQRLIAGFDLAERSSSDPLKRKIARAARTALENGELTFTTVEREGTTFDPIRKRSILNLVTVARRTDLIFTGKGEIARGPDYLQALMGHVARQVWGNGIGGAETLTSEGILHAAAEGHVAQHLFDPAIRSDPNESAESVRARALRQLAKTHPALRHLRDLNAETIAAFRKRLAERAREIADAPGDQRKKEAARAVVLLLAGPDVEISTTPNSERGGYSPITRHVSLHISAIAEDLEAYAIKKGRTPTKEEFLDSVLGTLVHEGAVHRVQGFDVKPPSEGPTRPYRRAHEVEAFLLQGLFDPTLGSKLEEPLSGTDAEALARVADMAFERYPDRKIGDLNSTILRGVDPAKLERWEKARADAEEILRTHGDPDVAGDLLYRELESLLFDRTIPAKEARVRGAAEKLRAAKTAHERSRDIYSYFRDAAQRRRLLAEVSRIAAGFELVRWRESVRGRLAEEERLLEILREAGIGNLGATSGGAAELDARLVSVAAPPWELDPVHLRAELDATMEALTNEPGDERLLRRALRLRTLLGGLGAFGAAGPAADFPIVVDAPGRDGLSPVEALQVLLAEARRTETVFRHDASLRTHLARLRAGAAALTHETLEPAGDLEAALEDGRWDEFWAGFHAEQRRVLAPLLHELAR